MDHSAFFIALIGLSVLYDFTNADVGVPFTHDFNTSLHGWIVGPNNWNWTGDSGSPDTTNISTFHCDGNYIWTQKSFQTPTPTPSLLQYLYYEFVTGVTNETQLHFDYWLYTQDANCADLAIAYVEKNAQKSDSFHVKMIINNSSDWDTFTIDCGHDHCCSGSSCDLQLFMYGSAGCSDGNGLIAIRSVSATTNTTDTTILNSTDMPDTNSTDTPTINSTDTLDTNSTDVPNVNSTDTPTINSTDTLDTNSTDTLDSNSTDTPTINSTDTIDTNSTDTLIVNSTDTPININSTDTPTINSTDKLTGNSTDTPYINSTDVLNVNSTDAPIAFNCTDLPTVNSTDIPNINSTEAITVNLTDTITFNSTDMTSVNKTKSLKLKTNKVPDNDSKSDGAELKAMFMLKHLILVIVLELVLF